ncbi:MAG: hypothetical protein DHS20C16_02760 [Phycisphaerae bacterium]|nr:MAG: hypothetical protein DHS20C16_02760 [Phycisphaerae bacterium]
MKFMFYTIEVNLLLWLGVCGMLWTDPSQNKNVTYLATLGCALAALFQHFAYHRIYKKH